MYGGARGAENRTKHGESNGWRTLLELLVEKQAARYTDDKRKVLLQVSEEATKWVKVHLRSRGADSFAALLAASILPPQASD